MNSTTLPDTYPATEVAARLGVGHSTLLRAVKRGDPDVMALRPVRLGEAGRRGRVVFPKAIFDQRVPPSHAVETTIAAAAFLARVAGGRHEL
ncbi:hypothetical protein CPHO_07235 [Corynebacterium phocae]|uniref:Helix-turn-helix domain-containing protein n=1 Tax=Corynebacterium phocae TaxID=161895 RepID=A0A1L7D3R8_9CORY|nr:hypothetical protein [Corynebacterium phocae]APT92717.1 hypothetical protein CPHO_07235 [Corynebacterium phocae]KAA8723024.1 hypothetical protein F4V58_06740 [Corynebacterium phocae]